MEEEERLTPKAFEDCESEFREQEQELAEVRGHLSVCGYEISDERAKVEKLQRDLADANDRIKQLDATVN